MATVRSSGKDVVYRAKGKTIVVKTKPTDFNVTSKGKMVTLTPVEEKGSPGAPTKAKSPVPKVKPVPKPGGGKRVGEVRKKSGTSSRTTKKP